ncbi:MAG: methyltransferase domain-containing protein [Minisyncoccia bacterium]
MNYDKIAEIYDSWGKTATTDWELGHKNVAKLLEPIEGKRILDFGCGNGKFSIFLHNLGAEVVGIDISATQLEVARKGTMEITYLQDTDPRIEKDFSGYFDAGILIFVLCEISSQEAILAVLKRVHNLLKGGAELVILNPNWDKSNGKDFLTHQMQFNPELKLGGHVTTILKGNPPIHIPDYYWSKEVYLEMLSKAGFGEIQIHEPLAPNDGTPWKDEKEFPPFLIIKSKKI